jgi:signal transduction histidine kinase
MERLRLAQNLHDTPLQELYAAIYKLEELRPTTRPATAETIGQVIDDIKHTLAGLRQTASELRPPSLSRFGLEKAIRSYVEDFRQKYPALHLELALARDRQLLSEDTRLVLFRVFQEAMANVTRHSHATEVKVRFAFDAEEARLEVSDNGRGFEVPGNWMSNVRAGHYGLAGMAERVSAAGGTLTLESTPDGPTTIRAVVPC